MPSLKTTDPAIKALNKPEYGRANFVKKLANQTQNVFNRKQHCTQDI